MKNSKIKIYQDLFKRLSYYGTDESMNRVVSGKYSYVYFRSNLESLVNTQFTTPTGETNLHISSEEFFPGGYAWAFPKVNKFVF